MIVKCISREDEWKVRQVNAVIFALSEDNARDAVLRLQREKMVNIVAWLGVDKGQGVITHDYGQLQNIDVLREYYNVCPQPIYDKVYLKLYIFLDMVFRNGERPLYECVNLFNLWIDFYYGLFSKRNVQLVIFGDTPHFGVDSIAKDVADAMGIPTVLFKQAFEDNRFFAFLYPEDVGVFETLPNDSKFSATLDGQFEKDSIMTDIQMIRNQFKKEQTTNTQKSWIDKLYNMPTKVYRHRKHLVSTIKKHVATKMCITGRTYMARTSYSENSGRALRNNTVNLDVPYVYFPLQRQPEATTSVWGKEYCDQLLALERLSDFVPHDWKIYVKENPVQTYYMREDLFFKRLELIPKAYYVDRELNTYDLIRNSQFVATITGTAGWEAISGGKPALVFGWAWYRKLPGVFEYDNHPQLKDILQYQFSLAEVEEAYNRLNSKAYPGILELGREHTVEGYTPEKNNELLYKAFVRILGLLQAGDVQATD